MGWMLEPERAMKTMKFRVEVARIVVMCGVSVAAAVMGSSALAGDRAKTANYAKGQTDQGAPVRAGDGTRSFWRAIDEDAKPVNTGHGPNKMRRAADREDDTVLKTGGGTKSFWRAIDEDGESIKIGDSQRFTRAADEMREPTKHRAATKIPGRKPDRDRAENKAETFEPIE
jgi:hypothetical protein